MPCCSTGAPSASKRWSTHPEQRALAPLIGIETGSVRIARQIMAGKALPFDIKDWPHIVLNGLEALNRNNWFPVCTLIAGSLGETDEDSMATLDLLYEADCRGLHCMWVPSIFTPLVKTRMEHGEGVRVTQQLTKLQWQVIMKAWAVASRIGLQTTWGKFSFGVGSLRTVEARQGPELHMAARSVLEGGSRAVAGTNRQDLRRPAAPSGHARPDDVNRAPGLA